jgi:hypothetical protein
MRRQQLLQLGCELRQPRACAAHACLTPHLNNPSPQDVEVLNPNPVSNAAPESGGSVTADVRWAPAHADSAVVVFASEEVAGEDDFDMLCFISMWWQTSNCQVYSGYCLTTA